MKKVVLAAMLAMPASAGLAQQVVDGSGGELGENLPKDIALSLMAEVKDPFSAQLAKLHTSTGSDDIVCGFINLKNGLGTYTGFRPFFFSIEAKRIFLQPSSGC